MKSKNINQSVINQLNHLLALAVDGKKSYEAAAHSVDSASMKITFMGYSKQRAAFVRQLEEQIRILEGTPTNYDGDGSGAMHRLWINLKSLAMNKEIKNIVDTCLTGEEVVLKAYTAALFENYITGSIHEILFHQRLLVYEAMDEIRTLAMKNETLKIELDMVKS
jgi:uncharacterized protein (TIGR02284 family)